MIRLSTSRIVAHLIGRSASESISIADSTVLGKILKTQHVLAYGTTERKKGGW